MSSTRRLAFTLVELLVVIAIIGILIGLLLPAIQSARESGRRTQCENNLKQLSLAAINYEQAMAVFPPSCTWAKHDPGEITSGMDNWVIKILPFLEYNQLYNQFDHQKPMSNAVNAQARSQIIKEMLCPSDGFYNSKPFNGSAGPETAHMGDNWARGDYAANGALGFLSLTNSPYPSGGPGTEGWRDPRIRGIMGSDCSLASHQITDGLSHTVLIAEIRAGLTDYDTRGVWAMSGACPSSLWAHAYFTGDDYGPNCLEPEADDMVNCSKLASTFGGEDALVAQWMPCWPGDGSNWQQTARSMHSGGVYVALADGSVQWINDLIDCSPSVLGRPSVWDCLMASGDGKTIPADAF